MDHEAAFAKAFLPSERRARFVQLLAQPKRRQEVLGSLDHDLRYLPAFASEVAGRQDFPDELVKLLLAKGAGAKGLLIGRGLQADGRELPLREALVQICLQGSGAILSCLPGRLAYYKPEAPGAGVILERPLP